MGLEEYRKKRHLEQTPEPKDNSWLLIKKNDASAAHPVMSVHELLSPELL